MQYGLAVSWMLCSGAAVQLSPPAVTPRRSWVVTAPTSATERVDPSGIARVGADLVVVSDKAHLPLLYRLTFNESRLVRMQAWRPVGGAEVGHDTEGLTICDGTMWVVVEGDNQLVRLPLVGDAEVLKLDFSAVGTEIPSAITWMNAGLEGVACASDGRIWVAKEREPRAIFTIDARTGSATGVWEQWARADRVRELGGRDVAPSWSDLQFLDGHLYALHRDGRAVVRLDPSSGVQTALMHLELDEQAIYSGASPYGMAEGLWIEGDAVWILLDNNDDTMKAGPRAGEPAPMLFEYPRPEGF